MLTCPFLLVASVLACFIIDPSQGWVLEINEKHVAKKLTTNVTFQCVYDGDDNGAAPIAQVSRIRLLKFQSGNKWNTVAKLSDLNQQVTTSFHYQPAASGLAAGLSDSFLSLYFDIATSDVIGQFMCEIDGYDVDDELAAVKTDPVIVNERGVSFDDLLTIILQYKATESSDHTANDIRLGLLEKAVRILENQGKSRQAAIGQIANRVNTLNNDFLRVSDELIKNQKEILKHLDTLQESSRVQNQAWPEGVYTLPNTTSGCPTSYSFDWATSYLRITTQRGAGNLDNTSTPIHMETPILESTGAYHYVHMRFCTKKMEVAGPAWPKGSYCINSYNRNCPKNLNPGNLQIDRDNIGTDTVTDLTLAAKTGDITTIIYCCRDDGDASTPVLLPSQDPFYLYRHGGKCQEVMGMNVSDEWLFLDTMESKDATNNNYHPDVTLRNIKLQMCYYTPSP